MTAAAPAFWGAVPPAHAPAEAPVAPPQEQLPDAAFSKPPHERLEFEVTSIAVLLRRAPFYTRLAPGALRCAARHARLLRLHDASELPRCAQRGREAGAPVRGVAAALARVRLRLVAHGTWQLSSAALLAARHS
jgi:hypothetical protein